MLRGKALLLRQDAESNLAMLSHDQVAIALSKSANEATVTRSRSEEDQLALAKRESLAIVSHSSKAEALSYQYWDSNWYGTLSFMQSCSKSCLCMDYVLLDAA